MKSRKITIVDLTERALPLVQCMDDGFTVCHLPSPDGGAGKVACIPGEAIAAMHSERRRNARLKSAGKFALGLAAVAISFYAGVATARAEVLDLTKRGVADPVTRFIVAYDQVPWKQKGEELLKSGAQVKRLCFPQGDKDGNFESTCFVFLEGGKTGGTSDLAPHGHHARHG